MPNSDLSTISSEIVRSAITTVIETELKSKDFVVEIESASKAGSNNFIGIVSRANFRKDEESNESNNEIRSLIIKSAPDDVELRDHLHVRHCFMREIYMYTEVLPFFRYFEQCKGITGGDDAFTEYPKCFRTVDIELNECVLLEDLKIRGFIPIDRHTEEPNYHHIRLYLLAVAKYHAISLAIKDQQPEKFQSLTANTKFFMIDRDNESFRAYFNEQVQYASNLLSAEEDAHFLTKLKQFFSKDALDIFVDLLEQGAMEPTAVISYGDANLNNSLFIYDNNKKPVEICLLDWQESWLGTPIADIVYYLFVSVTKDVRDAHYDNLLNEYHAQLSTHLRRLGSDPEKLFPYELMKEHLRKYARQAILLAFMALPALTSEPDYCYFDEPAEGVTTESDDSSSVRYNSKFNEKMRDVVKDIVKLGYI